MAVGVSSVSSDWLLFCAISGMSLDAVSSKWRLQDYVLPHRFVLKVNCANTEMLSAYVRLIYMLFCSVSTSVET